MSLYSESAGCSYLCACARPKCARGTLFMEMGGADIPVYVAKETVMNLQPIFLSPVVSKPPSITCRHAAPSASEHALYAFLRKRHENYLRKLSNCTEGNKEIDVSAPVSWDLPDTGKHISKCYLLLKCLPLCSDVAEHVVSHARRRLLKRSHRHKTVNILTSRQHSSNFKLVKTCHLQKSQEKATLHEHPHVHLKMISTRTNDTENKKESKRELSASRVPHEVSVAGTYTYMYIYIRVHCMYSMYM